MDRKQISTTTLAYLGDSVWELAVRDHLLSLGYQRVDKMHREAVRFVSANAQENILKILMEGVLTEEELSLVKRARNHKLISSKKNSKRDEMTDKYATAFEALIGYLYLDETPDRLDYIISAAFLIVDKTK